MTEEPRRAPAMPAEVDPEVPNAARIYDYCLGGEHNFEADRQFGKKVISTWPTSRQLAMQNRSWLRRIVVDALNAGIRQFLDLGSGVPTMGNVHETVRNNLPEGERARVVYVDYEPVAAERSRLILERDNALDWAAIVQEDVREPAAIFNHSDTQRLLDFDEPISLQMVAVLPFIGPDDHPDQLLDTYRGALAPGSRLSISQVSVDGADPEDAAQVRRVTASYRDTLNPFWLRDRPEIEAWFDGWPMVEPGLVRLPDWKPEPDTELTTSDLDARQFCWCGVATKP
ncbi:MAG: SAM-dependent methyltransferase [Sciscionella sp.]